MNRLLFDASRDIRFGGGIQLRVAEERPDGKLAVWTAITVEVRDGGDYVPPLVQLKEANAQALIDELWRAGLRPSDIGSAGHLAATKLHLEDMQAIAMALLRRDGLEL